MQPNLSELSGFKDGLIPDDFIIDNGPELDPNATFRERLMVRFTPSDVVNVTNPGKKPYSWSFMPESNEVQVPDGQRTGYHTYRKKPETYTIQPGQTMPLMGANAYVMIEGLFKALVFEWATANDKKTNLILQPSIQDEWIDKILVDAHDPLALATKTQVEEEVIDEEDTLEADLGLTTETPRRGRRPKQAA